MKKAAAIIVVLAVIIIGAVFVAMNKKSNTPTNNQTSTNTSAQTSKQSDMASMQSQASTSTAPQAVNTVAIKDMAFSPANITVKKGATVTWTNEDAIAHTVHEADGQTGPKSAPLEKGQSYSFTYTTAGTYKYDCSIHPNMTGSVIVTE